MNLTKARAGDIIKLSNETKTVLGRVVDATDESVLIFRDTGDIWYSLDEFEMEILEFAQ